MFIFWRLDSFPFRAPRLLLFSPAVTRRLAFLFFLFCFIKLLNGVFSFDGIGLEFDVFALLFHYQIDRFNEKNEEKIRVPKHEHHAGSPAERGQKTATKIAFPMLQ